MTHNCCADAERYSDVHEVYSVRRQPNQAATLDTCHLWKELRQSVEPLKLPEPLLESLSTVVPSVTT